MKKFIITLVLVFVAITANAQIPSVEKSIYEGTNVRFVSDSSVVLHRIGNVWCRYTNVEFNRFRKMYDLNKKVLKDKDFIVDLETLGDKEHVLLVQKNQFYIIVNDEIKCTVVMLDRLFREYDNYQKEVKEYYAELKKIDKKYR
jgi:hypothetical protein